MPALGVRAPAAQVAMAYADDTSVKPAAQFLRTECTRLAGPRSTRLMKSTLTLGLCDLAQILPRLIAVARGTERSPIVG